MSRKQKRAVAKSGPVWHQSAEEATLARMPKYNAHACGTGAHGDAKYNRARQKRAWQKELNNEGLRNRGGLPLLPWVRQPGWVTHFLRQSVADANRTASLSNRLSYTLQHAAPHHSCPASK